MRHLLICAAALCSASAARADLRATYVNGAEEMVLEANDDGTVRLESAKPGEYTLVTPTGSFIVFEEAGRQRAASMTEFRAVLDEMMAAMWAQLGAEAPAPAQPPEGTVDTPLFEEAGTATVNGRTGRVYREVKQEEDVTLTDEELEELGLEGEAADAARDPKPAELVISDDPALAPLGTVWAQLFTMMPSFGNLMGGGPGEQERQFASLLNGRGVLKLDTIELRDVVTAPIDDARFAIPASLLTRAELKAMLDKGGPKAE
jgi:hypothetical protein